MPRNTNQSPKQPQPAKLRRAASGAPIRGIPQGHHDDLCGLTNPFCDQAKHAKIPDIGAGTSFTEQVRYDATLNATATGECYACIAPKTNNVLLRNDGTTPTNWKSTYDTSSANSLVQDYGGSTRIVTYGVRIVSLMSATDAKGSVALASGLAPTLGATVITNADGYSHYDLHSVGSSSEWHMIGKPTGSDSTDYVDAVNYNSTTEGAMPGWNSLFIIGEGLPQGAVFRVEIVINYEFMFLSNSGLRKLQTDQPVFNPSMLSARNEVMTSARHVVKGAKSSLEAHVKTEAKKALTKHVLPWIAKRATTLLT